jgi:glycerophosphoryl diester phosphodiesterase
MSWRRLPDQLPLVLGHRGARARAPENTMAAFELALDAGAAGVELDVRLERSGEVIVLHDLGGGTAIPRLTDVIAWAQARGARVNVELKSDVSRRERLVARTVALLAHHGASADHFLLSSFHAGMVLRAVELTRAWMTTPVPVALLVHPQSPHLDTHPTWRELGAAGVHPAAELASADRLERWRAHGALVNVWTVNDPHRARQLTHLGVDAIITDDPATIVPALMPA